MTVLKSGKTRGFFDPITMGVYVPASVSRMNDYKDQVAALEIGTFVHEVTHYIQIFGTVFGYTYLLSMRALGDISARLVDKNAPIKDRFPILKSRVELFDRLETEEKKEFAIQALTLNRYFNEELHGITFPFFQLEPIVNKGGLLLSSPLFLDQAEGGVLPITGEVILENNAALNELDFWAKNVPENMTRGSFEEAYDRLKNGEKNKYFGLTTWFATLGVSEIEPILYFILLNQPMEHYLQRMGDYTLASNMKAILVNSHKFRNLKKPINDQQVIKTIDTVCGYTGLENPLTELKKAHGMLFGSSEDENWTVNTVSLKIWEFFIKQPHDAIYWHLSPWDILNKIPVLNVYSDDVKDGSNYSHIGRQHGFTIEEAVKIVRFHNEYSKDLHVYLSLINSNRVKCYFSLRSHPNVCDSCSACDGFLPNEKVGKDCLFFNNHADLFSE